MNDTLHDLMRESAETIPTSAPPVAAITRAGRRRRTSRVALVAAAVVGLGATGGTVAPHLGGERDVAPAAPTRDYAPDEVPVFLPESAFYVEEDDVIGSDRLEGELRATEDDRCLVVGDARTLVYWPQGWEGLTRGDGSFELLDQDGVVAATVGDTVRVRGILTEGGVTYSGADVCAGGTDSSFMVTALEVID